MASSLNSSALAAFTDFCAILVATDRKMSKSIHTTSAKMRPFIWRLANEGAFGDSIISEGDSRRGMEIMTGRHAQHFTSQDI